MYTSRPSGYPVRYTSHGATATPAAAGELESSLLSPYAVSNVRAHPRTTASLVHFASTVILPLATNSHILSLAVRVFPFLLCADHRHLSRK